MEGFGAGRGVASHSQRVGQGFAYCRITPGYDCHGSDFFMANILK